LEIRLLGKTEARDTDGPLRFRSHKATEIIAYLAYAGPTGASRSSLAAALWPELEVSRRLHNLRVNLVYIKQAAPELLSRYGSRDLALAPTVRVDVWSFRDAVAEAKEGSSIAPWQKAFDLYEGEFAPDIQADWAVAARDNLASEYLEVLLRLAADELERDAVAAKDYADQAVRLDPYLQSARTMKVQALIALDERAGAAKEIEAYAELLRRDLRIEPDDVLYELIGMPRRGLRMVWPADDAEFRALSAGQRLALEANLAQLYYARGYLNQGRQRVQEALDRAGDASPEASAAFAALSLLDSEAGDFRRALLNADRALTTAKTPHDEAGARAAVARAHSRSGALAAASEQVAAALALARTHGYEDLEAECLVIGGIIRFYQHRTSRSLQTLTEAIRKAKANHAYSILTRALNAAASCLFKMGRLPEAAEMFEDAILTAREARMPIREAHSKGSLGRVREAQGRLQEARTLYEETLEDMSGLEAPTFRAVVVTYLADLALKMGDAQQSKERHEVGIALRRMSGDRLGLATNYRGLGKALTALRQLDEAVAALTSAAKIYSSMSDEFGSGTAHIALAEAFGLRGDRAEATSHLDHAERIVRKLNRTEVAELFEDELFTLGGIEKLRLRLGLAATRRNAST
jgi:DNA-binding SARP family transcriptional activator/tetratricopeptide (TPR) repeat protein